ncbi:hypothetical protein SDC9_166773 [bioreactor metagenome]|uniref:Uncharacterized protein n=1 Tax=bioreactor metagenome TaxID=1076179 RepID=A0A645G5I6_9ZZZZ
MFQHEVAQDGEQGEFPVQRGRQVVMQVVRNALRVIVPEGVEQSVEFSGAVFADEFRVEVDIGPFCADRELRVDDEQRRSSQIPFRIAEDFTDAGGDGGSGVEKKRYVGAEGECEFGQYFFAQFPVMVVEGAEDGGGVGAAAAHTGGDGDVLLDPERPRRGDAGHVGISEGGASGEVFEVLRQSGQRGGDPDAGGGREIGRDPVSRFLERQEQRFQLVIPVRASFQHLQIEVDFRPGGDCDGHAPCSCPVS